jgi:hypothetical protein
MQVTLSSRSKTDERGMNVQRMRHGICGERTLPAKHRAYGREYDLYIASVDQNIKAMGAHLVSLYTQIHMLSNILDLCQLKPPLDLFNRANR